jgi:exopolysaccharide biosynthesis protein
VVCDGRGNDDSGMTLGELASLMVELGAESAINLDGGGSTSLVRDGRLVNRPREEHGLDLPAGRPVSTALVFVPL